MTVTGLVKGQKITATGNGSDVVLGNQSKAVLEAEKKVSVKTTNGDILNNGTDADLIKSKDVYLHAEGGTIGEAPTEPGIGEDAVVYENSINVNATGKVKAFTTKADGDGDINIAAKTGDLNVDRIKADGDVYLTTEKGSILNAATDLDNYANVNGKSVQMISAGSVGTASKALHFRQTDSTKESNVLAKGDVNLHQRGTVDEAVNFNTIKSKNGSVEANMIKSGTIKTVAAKDTNSINVTARKKDADMTVTKKTSSSDTSLIKDYFD